MTPENLCVAACPLAIPFACFVGMEVKSCAHFGPEHVRHLNCSMSLDKNTAGKKPPQGIYIYIPHGFTVCVYFPPKWLRFFLSVRLTLGLKNEPFLRPAPRMSTWGMRTWTWTSWGALSPGRLSPESAEGADRKFLVEN